MAREFAVPPQATAVTDGSGLRSRNDAEAHSPPGCSAAAQELKQAPGAAAAVGIFRPQVSLAPGQYTPLVARRTVGRSAISPCSHDGHATGNPAMVPMRKDHISLKRMMR